MEYAIRPLGRLFTGLALAAATSACANSQPAAELSLDDLQQSVMNKFQASDEKSITYFSKDTGTLAEYRGKVGDDPAELRLYVFKTTQGPDDHNGPHVDLRERIVKNSPAQLLVVASGDRFGDTSDDIYSPLDERLRHGGPATGDGGNALSEADLQNMKSQLSTLEVFLEPRR